MGIEISIPLLLLTLLQGVGTVVQTRFDLTNEKQRLLTNRLIIALSLAGFNWFRILNVLDDSIVDTVFFVFNCGLVSTLILDKEIKNRKVFLVVSSLNILVFALVYSITFWLLQISVYERVIMLSLVLIIYFIAYSTVQLFKDGATENFTPSIDSTLIGFVLILIAFLSLLIENIELVGILTLNVFYLGLVASAFVKRRHLEKSPITGSNSHIVAPLSLAENSSLRTELATYKLSATQLKVAELLLQGHKVTEIATKQGVSENAIHQQCHKINKKTGCVTTLEFVLKFGNHLV